MQVCGEKAKHIIEFRSHNPAQLCCTYGFLLSNKGVSRGLQFKRSGIGNGRHDLDKTFDTVYPYGNIRFYVLSHTPVELLDILQYTRTFLTNTSRPASSRSYSSLNSGIGNMLIGKHAHDEREDRTN